MRTAPLIAFLFLPRFASADGPGDRSWLSVAGAFGRSDVGDVHHDAAGAWMAIGHAFGVLHVQAEYSVLALTTEEKARGTAHRVGGVLRLPWWQIGEDKSGYMDLAVEVGGGYSFVTFEQRDGVDWPDVQLGVTSAWVVNTGGDKKRRDFGLTFGVKVQLAGLGEDTRHTTLLGLVGLTFGR